MSNSLPEVVARQGQCIGCVDHATTQTHAALIQSSEREIIALKERMNRMEEKYDIIYEMATSIKVLSTQMVNINDSVHEMKHDFNENIKDIKQKQLIISDKVDKVAIESDVGITDVKRRQKMKNDLAYSIIEKIVLIIVIILLATLFPHLSDFIK